MTFFHNGNNIGWYHHEKEENEQENTKDPLFDHSNDLVGIKILPNNVFLKESWFKF